MNKTYGEQRTLVQQYRVGEGETLRCDCPFCHGKNTFTITKAKGVVRWNCYRASCHLSGAYTYARSIEEIRRSISGRNKIVDVKPNITPIPDLLVSPLNSGLCVATLNAWNCTDMVEKVGIRYSPKENRLMFPIKDKMTVVGYVGRTMSANEKPRWKKYGDTTHLFSCGEGTVGVLVEDTASACAASKAGCIGIALLGTTLTTTHKLELNSFNLKRLVVCLDPDAAALSLKMLRQLSMYVETTVRFCKADLKYYDTDDIVSLLNVPGINALQKPLALNTTGAKTTRVVRDWSD